MSCLLCLCINVGKSLVTCIYYELVVVKHTSNNASRNIIALLYGGELGGKQFRIKIGVTTNLENFSNIDEAS